jgi:hypothetical protein
MHALIPAMSAMNRPQRRERNPEPGAVRKRWETGPEHQATKLPERPDRAEEATQRTVPGREKA